MAYGLMGGIGTGLSGFEEAFSRAQGRQDTLSAANKEREMRQAILDQAQAEKEQQAQGLMATNYMLSHMQNGIQGPQAPPVGIASQEALALQGKTFTPMQAMGLPQAQQQALTGGVNLAGADIGKYLTLQNAMKPKSITPKVVEMVGSKGLGQYLVNPQTGQSSFLGGSQGKEQPFKLIEYEDGRQGWIKAGGTIPEGAKVTKSGGNVFNIGNDKDTAREAYAKEISDKYAGNSLFALKDMKTLAKDSTVPVFGAAGLVASQMPGTNAFAIAQGINTVQSSISFNRLNEMRQSSKTGGALGSVSEPELKMLRDSVASLNQGLSEEQFWKNWERVKINFDQVINGPSGANTPTTEPIKQRLKYNPQTGDFE